MKTIKFLDQGQDFLEWIIKDDVIIDCQPFQFKVWAGKKVRICGNKIFVKANEFVPVIYPIKSISDTNADYQSGYADGLINQKNTNTYSWNDQYKFGFNVGLYNKNLELKHA